MIFERSDWSKALKLIGPIRKRPFMKPFQDRRKNSNGKTYSCTYILCNEVAVHVPSREAECTDVRFFLNIHVNQLASSFITYDTNNNQK